MTASWLSTREEKARLGIRILLFVCRLLGRTGARALLVPIVFYYVAFRPSVRRASRGSRRGGGAGG
jgi:predicted LPLAT superfamily acyltransferase